MLVAFAEVLQSDMKPNQVYGYLVYPVNKYLLKVSNRITRKRCEICSKLIIKTLKQRQLCQNISKYSPPFCCVFIIEIDQMFDSDFDNVYWVVRL